MILSLSRSGRTLWRGAGFNPSTTQLREETLDRKEQRPEFAEIGLAKVKIKLILDDKGAIALRLTGVDMSSALQIGVSLDGTRLEYWPLFG